LTLAALMWTFAQDVFSEIASMTKHLITWRITETAKTSVKFAANTLAHPTRLAAAAFDVVDGEKHRLCLSATGAAKTTVGRENFFLEALIPVSRFETAIFAKGKGSIGVRLAAVTTKAAIWPSLLLKTLFVSAFLAEGDVAAFMRRQFVARPFFGICFGYRILAALMAKAILLATESVPFLAVKPVIDIDPQIDSTLPRGFGRCPYGAAGAFNCGNNRQVRDVERFGECNAACSLFVQLTDFGFLCVGEKFTIACSHDRVSFVDRFVVRADEVYHHPAGSLILAA